MIKAGGLLTKKTLHELAKEFPNKTYTELEKYRNADRQEEAQQIFTHPANEEFKEDPVAKRYEERIEELQKELNRVKKENNTLYNRIAKLTEDPLRKARESGL